MHHRYATGYTCINLALPFLTSANCQADAALLGGTEVVAGGPSTAAAAACAVGTGQYGLVVAAYPIAKAVTSPALGTLAGLVACG